MGSNRWRLHGLALEGALEPGGRQLLGASAEPRPTQFGDQMLEPRDPLGQCLGANAGLALGRHRGGNPGLHGVAPLGRKPVETRGVEGGRRHAEKLSDRAVPAYETGRREARVIRPAAAGARTRRAIVRRQSSPENSASYCARLMRITPSVTAGQANVPSSSRL